MAMFSSFLVPILAMASIMAALAIALVVAERILFSVGVCRVDINSGGKVLEVDGGQTLLSALQGEGVFIPAACGGRGSCGYCKIKVVDGGGRVLPTETPYLTRKEVRAGVRLACQVKLWRDIAVKIPEDLLDVKLFSATVESTRHLTHDVKEISLRLVDPPQISHRPGQYVQIQAPSPEGPVFRAYSISSPACEGNLIEMIVHLVPGGVVSTYLHNLKGDENVAFTGPFGEFRVSEDPSVEIICVAGGRGMAPARSIIHSVYDKWPDRSVWFFFGCRTTRDVFCLEEYRELARRHANFHVVYTLSAPPDPQEQWDGETGLVHHSVDRRLESGARRQAFLCGPPPMIEAVTHVLEGQGLRAEDIFCERF